VEIFTPTLELETKTLHFVTHPFTPHMGQNMFSVLSGLFFIARPTWLDLAHKKLDEAVFAAYGWKSNLSDEEILEKLLILNLESAKG